MSLIFHHLLKRPSCPVERVVKLLLILTLAGSAAGCFHEARVTGQTQCFAPRDVKAALADAGVQGESKLSARSSVTAN